MTDDEVSVSVKPKEPLNQVEVKDERTPISYNDINFAKTTGAGVVGYSEERQSGIKDRSSNEIIGSKGLQNTNRSKSDQLNETYTESDTIIKSLTNQIPALRVKF